MDPLYRLSREDRYSFPPLEVVSLVVVSLVEDEDPYEDLFPVEYGDHPLPYEGLFPVEYVDHPDAERVGLFLHGVEVA